ncbi:MAG: PorP/SprF family type IX secretion system membrane protein [Paludibacteraceae bacterium]|nr:PorP/SprF family type IX secretion system membrane protein [Paludibacteraceae bacterium]
MKNKFILVIAAMASSFMANAQQDMMLSQEIFSRINKNPAGTGNTETIDAFLHGRIQWAGVDNGPKSSVLNVTNYSERLKSGMGLTLSYDNIGVGHSTTNVKAVYAYHIDVTDNTLLSLGLSAGANFAYFNPDANTVSDDAEYGTGTLGDKKETNVTPDIDFGFELSQQSWTLGASVTHLINSEMSSQRPGRHYYVYGTTLIPLNNKWDLSPTLSYMHRNKTNVMEIGSFGYYNRLLWGGIFWRPDLNEGCNPSMMVFTLGCEWKQFRFGYSYDLGLGSKSKLPSNTHEIILSMSINKGNR